ncbi:MAG: hypothetical protein ACOY3Y_03085, partial [Acidobacteriota bacterium]
MGRWAAILLLLGSCTRYGVPRVPPDGPAPEAPRREASLRADQALFDLKTVDRKTPVDLKLVDQKLVDQKLVDQNKPDGPSGPKVATFSYSGAVQTFAVPAGVTSITVKAWGAGGGGRCGWTNAYGGGGGGFAQATLAVTPLEPLKILVGGGGKGETWVSNPGGFGGGGAGGTGTWYGFGGGGRS